jgi:hypothetical protein
MEVTMSELEIIESQVERLDAKSFAAFRTWFIEYEHARWDQQLEEDSHAGKLDSLINEAVAEYKAGHSTPH